MIAGTDVETIDSEPADFEKAISHTGNNNIYNYIISYITCSDGSTVFVARGKTNCSVLLKC